MPLPRYLVPVAAALIIAGLVAAVVVAINNKPDAVTTSGPADSRGIADLLALKADAEKLAIEGKLAEAHAKYQELFVKAEGRKIESLQWDILERAKDAQDRIYATLLIQQEAKVLASRASTRPGGGYAAWSMADAKARESQISTTQSAGTQPGAATGAVVLRADPSVPATSSATTSPSTQVAQPPLPKPKRFVVRRMTPD